MSRYKGKEAQKETSRFVEVLLRISHAIQIPALTITRYLAVQVHLPLAACRYPLLFLVERFIGH